MARKEGRQNLGRKLTGRREMRNAPGWLDMTEAQDERWHEAQRAESTYWRDVQSNEDEFRRIIDEKSEAAGFLCQHVGDELSQVRDGRAFEVGIGPMGIGVISALPWAEGWTLLGVDPLPLMKPELPPEAMATWEAVWDSNYTHVRGMGENAPVASGSCDLAVCFNVLTHVSSPRAVLGELQRALKPGGYLLVGEEIRSCAGVLKMKLYTRLVHRGTILVGAHPHDFTGGGLEALVREAGLAIVAADRPHEGAFECLLGRGAQEHLVCRKE
jgi:SAM-dependent methyltransferase